MRDCWFHAEWKLTGQSIWRDEDSQADAPAAVQIPDLDGHNGQHESVPHLVSVSLSREQTLLAHEAQTEGAAGAQIH